MRQSFSYTLLITWVLIAVSCKTHFVQKSYETQNISVSTEVGVLDTRVLEMYQPYKNILEKDMNRIISVSEAEMTKGKPESLLTNFLGDLLLIEGAKEAKAQGYALTPAVSFFNYGGIRTSLPKGEITVGNVFELMPFENEMVFLELSGTQMQEFLNYIARKGGDSLGGARFVIANNEATNVSIGGKPLNENESYWLVTNDYVANGGDGLDVLKGSKQFKNSGRKIRDAIISNLDEKHKQNEKLNVNWMGGLVMDRRIFIRNMAAGAAGLTLGAVPYDLFANDDFTTISILHTNDMHCHIEPFTGTNERYANKGGLARIAELVQIERAKNPNTLLLDAGDMFQGTPYFNYFKGELMFKIMSAAGYDAGTIGNHEFDNGLEGILDPLPNAEFPLINSNYDFSDTILAGKFPRYKILKRSGIKIGIYGLGIELNGLVGKKQYENTVYNAPLQVALEMEQFLKNEKKCDLVICLSHLGLRYKNDFVSDMVLAAETSMTDLIIGGHTHSYLAEPIVEKNKIGKPVIVNQAWWGGLVVGKIDFVFERSKKRKKGTYSELLES